jgi:hypothetical protein
LQGCNTGDTYFVVRMGLGAYEHLFIEPGAPIYNGF